MKDIRLASGEQVQRPAGRREPDGIAFHALIFAKIVTAS